MSIFFDLVSPRGEMTAIAGLPIAEAGIPVLSSVGDPQVRQKRVFSDKTAPQASQTLISASEFEVAERVRRRVFGLRQGELANQLWANPALTANSLFSARLRRRINSFQLVFVLNSSLKILARV